MRTLARIVYLGADRHFAAIEEAAGLAQLSARRADTRGALEDNLAGGIMPPPSWTLRSAWRSRTS